MRWLRSHGAPAQDVAVYLSDLRDFFHLPSEEEHCLKLDQMASRWSALSMSTIVTTYIRTFMQLHGGQLSHMVYMTLSVGEQATRLKGSTMCSSNYGNGMKALFIAWSWPFTSCYLLFCGNQPWQTRARQL